MCWNELPEYDTGLASNSSNVKTWWSCRWLQRKKPTFSFLGCLSPQEDDMKGYNNHHTRRCNFGADAAFRSVRSRKPSEPSKRCVWFFYLFVLLGKICPSPSVLISNICLNSRTWPRIKFWPTSVFMTKWPSYLKISCFKLGINNQKLSSLEGQRPKGEEKLTHAVLWFCYIAFSELILRFYIMSHVTPWEQPESQQGKTW